MAFWSQAEDDQEKDTPIEPKGPKSAWITSPAATSTGLVNEPASSMWPGSSMMSCRARRFARHKMPMAGWPMPAADTPDSSMTPSFDSVTAHQDRKSVGEGKRA